MAKVAKTSPINIGDVINGEYKIISELGRGGFGAVYEVEGCKGKFAMKVELQKPNKDEPGLSLETCVIKRLQSSPHVVRYIDSGVIAEKHGFLIMQLVGRNLAVLRRAFPDQKFTMGTAIKAGIECLDAIEHVHNADLLHRDIKPANFAIGKGVKEGGNIFILDFGMVRRYRLKTGGLRKQRPRLGFRGTGKYASPNIHANIDISRRDDIWSWLYMVIEFIKGEQLPWKGIADKAEVARIKSTSKAKLVEGLGPEFTQIYEHVAKMKWAEAPQYDWMRQQMTGVMKKSKLSMDVPYDWEETGSYYKQASVAKVTSQPQEGDKRVQEKSSKEGESKTSNKLF